MLHFVVHRSFALTQTKIYWKFLHSPTNSYKPNWWTQNDLSSRSGTVYKAFFSAATSSPSFFTSPLAWWRNRQENHELEKYKNRIFAMAEKDAWMVGDAVSEIEESVNSWKAKVPGASSMNEIQLAKQMLKNLNGIVKVTGKDATENVLLKMSHKEKLIAAVHGETTLEEVNTLIEQFRTMSMMHRALRKRKLEGKTLPTTPEAVGALLKVEAPRLMSKEQKSELGKLQAKRMMNRRR